MEQAFADNLAAALDAILWGSVHEAAEGFEEALENMGLNPQETRVMTFQEAGLMTNNAGVVIRGSGIEVQLSVVSRGH